jgi:uncharacterized protein
MRWFPGILILLALSGCGRFFFYPDSNTYLAPETFKLRYRDLTFQSLDGTVLHGWFFPAAEKHGSRLKGTVVQFHGNGQNISSHYLSLVWLLDEGYQLFTFDYRGYGKSAGDPTFQGAYQDALSALEISWGLHQASGGGKFIVYGQSLGGAIALRAVADFKHADQIALVVADSTFASYKRITQGKMALFWLSWPLSPLGWLAVSDQYAPASVLDRIRARILVIHDKRDPTVEFEHGEWLFRAASSPKDFWILDDGLHIGVFSTGGGNQRRFVEYLETLPQSNAGET